MKNLLILGTILFSSLFFSFKIIPYHVSQSPRWECEKCHQTSYRNEKPCVICGGCEKNRNHEWRNVTRNSPKAECIKCGFITYLQPCRVCGGCEKNTNHNFKIFD